VIQQLIFLILQHISSRYPLWNLLKQPRQFLGVVVVVLQAGDMMIERINAGGGEQASGVHLLVAVGQG
jgi:hypothetical protein